MSTGAEGVGVQPAPHRGKADLWDDASCDHLLLDIGTGESGERESETMRKFTGHGLDLGGDAGGNGRDARLETALRGRTNAPGKIVGATC